MHMQIICSVLYFAIITIHKVPYVKKNNKTHVLQTAYFYMYFNILNINRNSSYKLTSYKI